MKTIIFRLIVALVIVSFVRITAAQACGGSTYTFTIYVRNGTVAKNAKYKIYQVKRKSDDWTPSFEKYLHDVFAPGWNSKEFNYNVWSSPAVSVELSTAQSFLYKYDQKQYSEPLIENPQGRNSLSGAFVDGRAVFYTYETDRTPYLIEVTANGYYPAYYLTHVFGGCRQGQNVLLQEAPRTR